MIKSSHMTPTVRYGAGRFCMKGYDNMKKENRKAAQERRAKERETAAKKQKMIRILVPVLVAAAIVVLVIGIIVSAQGDAASTSSAVASTDSDRESEASATTGAVSASSGSEDLVSASSGTQVAKNGDTVVIDYVGKIDGEAFNGGTAENQTLVLGSGQYIDGFEEQIVGHKVGETFDINVTFPDDYGVAQYAGKDAVFTVTLDAIK